MIQRLVSITEVPNFWEMYELTHKPIGAQYFNADQLINDALIWEGLRDETGTFVAFSGLKPTAFGLKGVTLATNGTKAAKKLAIKFIEGYKRNGYFAEMSGKPAIIAELLQVPKISNALAHKILGKPIMPLGDSYSYQRNLTNLGAHVKTLFGRPNIVE